MKPLERYLSAYVVDCLFGHGEDSPQWQELYQTLRESGGGTKHPVLSKVLDFIRQGDPQDSSIQHEVRTYVLAMAKGGSWQESEPVSDYKAMFSVSKGFVVFVITNSEGLVSVGVSKQDELDKAVQELKDTFPGIKIVQQ